MTLTPYRKSHPIDFNLTDGDRQPVLYVSGDGERHELVLTLRNTSPHALALHGAPAKDPSSGNHHFALRFRPGTLSDKTLALLTGDSFRDAVASIGWKIGRLKAPAANEAVTLYLILESDDVLRPNEERTLTLRDFSAAPGVGSRGTQVELVPHQIAYQGDSTPIAFVRTQYLHIASHRGQRDAPLEAAITSGATLLADGITPSSFTLRLQNIVRARELRFVASESLEATRFVISFEVGPHEAALVESVGAARFGVVHVGGSAGKTFSGGFRAQGTRVENTVMFYADTILAAGASIELTINGVVAAYSGDATLRIDYSNIPGYWDGSLTCRLVKSQLVPVEQRLGVGTRTPIGRFDVVGSEGEGRAIQIDNGEIKLRGGDSHFSIFNRGKGSLEIETSGSDPKMGVSERKLLRVHHKGNVRVWGVLEVGDPKNLKGGTFVDSSQVTFRVGYSQYFAILGHPDGQLRIVARGFGGGGADKTALVVDKSGKVDIGIDEPLSIMDDGPVRMHGERGVTVNGPIRGSQRTRAELEKRYPNLVTSFLDAMAGSRESPAILGGYASSQGGPADFLIRRSPGPLPYVDLDPQGKLTHTKRPSLPQIVDLGTGEAKTFIIGHPSDDARYLVHATLEGPEGAVFYRGTAQLSGGRARVELPRYFEALTRPEGRTLLLTNVDGFDAIAVRTQGGAQIKDGGFLVESANPASTQVFNWEVKAVRRDVRPLDVEPLRTTLEVQSFGPYTYGIPTRNDREDAAAT